MNATSSYRQMEMSQEINARTVVFGGFFPPYVSYSLIEDRVVFYKMVLIIKMITRTKA